MHEASQEAERKLAAIMAADVVGFSRMMGADEAATLARLHDGRRTVIDPVILRFRGRIFKVMGDGLLTEFPSSMLALRAAIAIQADLIPFNAAARDRPPIVLRIGIHQGDVLVHGDDLFGDGVNIAARLEPLAPHGGICISARVREDAFGKMALPFEDGGERMLKNISRPMRVFFLHGSQPEAPPPEPPGEPAVAEDDEANERTMFMPAQAHHHSLVVVEAARDGLKPGSVVPLSTKTLTLGRQPPSTLLLPGVEVSRTHCRLDVAGGTVIVTDLRSTNGTFVDGRRIQAPTPLATGDTIRIGPYTMRYVLDAPTEDPDSTYVWRG